MSLSMISRPRECLRLSVTERLLALSIRKEYPTPPANDSARRRLSPVPRRLDLDDLGSHHGELQGAVRRGKNLAQVDYADSLERQAHATLSLTSGRRRRARSA